MEKHNPYSYETIFDHLSLFSGLHCASVFGIVEVVAGLVEAKGSDINQIDCAGNTPLVWAALNGHEGVVKILLGRDDVNPNKPDVYDQTPLYCAAWYGHEGVVKTILARGDANSDKLDNLGRTPLWWAVKNGHAEVIALLQPPEFASPNAT